MVLFYFHIIGNNNNVTPAENQQTSDQGLKTQIQNMSTRLDRYVFNTHAHLQMLTTVVYNTSQRVSNIEAMLGEIVPNRRQTHTVDLMDPRNHSRVVISNKNIEFKILLIENCI